MFNCYHFNSITFNWLFSKFFHSILLKKSFIQIYYGSTQHIREKCFKESFAWWKLVCCTADCRDIGYGNTRLRDAKISRYTYNTEYRSLYYSDIYVNINNLKETNLRQWNVSSDEGGKCSFGPLYIITFGILCRELKNGSSEICRFRVLDELSKADLSSADCFI